MAVGGRLFGVSFQCLSLVVVVAVLRQMPPTALMSPQAQDGGTQPLAFAMAARAGLVFIWLDLLKDVRLRLSQTLPWRAAAEHPLCAVTFSLILCGKVYR